MINFYLKKKKKKKRFFFIIYKDESFKYWKKYLNNVWKIKKTTKEIEDNTVKNVRNLFRLKKETIKEINSNIVKNVRNLLRLRK